MNEQQKELLDLTKGYITAKNELEAVERQYKALYAKLYLQEKILGMKTESMRENEMTNTLETENSEFLNRLYDLRGKTREYYYRREALVICMRQGKIEEE